MKCVLQRVSHASVTVEGETVGAINQGLLIFFGCEKGDSEESLAYFLKKIPQLRIFSDDAGKMNLSIQDIKGSFLVVSQFTLAGDCRKGNRPGFDKALEPDKAKALYEKFVAALKSQTLLPVETGIFGADMAVTLLNDGPVTFILEN